MSRQHQEACLCLRLNAERHVHGHLVTVEVGVKRVTDEWVNLNCLAVNQDGLERLNAEAMQGRSTVEEHGMLGDDLFEDVPDVAFARLDHALSGLDVRDSLALDEPAHDERLEELECHQLRQTTLLQLELRTSDDHGTTRVIDALAEQVLTETSLLALEHVGQRLERAIARTRHGTAAATIVEQCVDGLLEHALLVVDDDLRRTEIKQTLEAVVAVDHAAVQVVQVRGREAATVELHHWAQLWRNHRNHLEDHPVRALLALVERGDDLQALDRALLLLALARRDHFLELLDQLRNVLTREQVANRFGTHAETDVLAEPVGGGEAVLQLAGHLLVADDFLRLDVLELLPRQIEHFEALVVQLVAVLLALLCVLEHLGDLGGPLFDAAMILAGHLARSLQAEIVRELLDVQLLGWHIWGETDDVGQEAVAESACLVELLTRAGRTRQLLGECISILGGIVTGEEGRGGLQRSTTGALLSTLAVANALDLFLQDVDRVGCNGSNVVDFLRGQIAVLTDSQAMNRVADNLLGRVGQLNRDLGQEATSSKPILGEAEALLLGPRVEHAGPVLVVIVEAVFGGSRDVLTTAHQALGNVPDLALTLGLKLVALGDNLALQLREVGGTRLFIDIGADVCSEVENLLEVLRCDVEQVADSTRHALKEPDVRDRSGEVDVTHALASHLLARDLDAAALANDALVADALVLTAVALPVAGRSEDALAKEPVLLRLEGAVVNRLWLGDLARRPGLNVLRRG